jgi:defect-in-organelle-trafficking protein DotD
MNIKLASIVASISVLSACTSTSPTVTTSTTSTDVSLSEASYAVSKSIVNLAEVAQASHPLPAVDPQPNPASFGMGQVISIDWSGPVEPLIRQLAYASNYRLRVLGSHPGIPVLVTVAAKNSLLADVVRDVGFQCGRRATVVVYPDSRVIELRYSKN